MTEELKGLVLQDTKRPSTITIAMSQLDYIIETLKYVEDNIESNISTADIKRCLRWLEYLQTGQINIK